MRQDEADDDYTVITNTFSIYSLRPILFYSGASYLLISALFAKTLICNHHVFSLY